MLTLPLYGAVDFDESIWSLARRPLCQRLRHVRLSNIDSYDCPGIAGVNRYEHALGTAFLAQKLPCQLSPRDRILLQASALIHDAGITPFGHLMEEALKFVGKDLNHESIWAELSEYSFSPSPGGLSLQILGGRESGLRDWADQEFGVEAQDVLGYLVKIIRGQSELGGFISNSIDLDNIDNVCRAAYHMGLKINSRLPLELVSSWRGIEGGVPVFEAGAKRSIDEWLSIRRQVYNRFMLSRHDFVLKTMILAATVESLHLGILSSNDWRLTDFQFLSSLLDSSNDFIKDTTRRWLVGDFWALSRLYWIEGNAPSFVETMEIAKELGSRLDRPVFGYRIVDKRERRIDYIEQTHRVTVGKAPKRWLCGFGSERRTPFSRDEEESIAETLRTRFGAIIGTVSKSAEINYPHSLFG